MVEKEIKAKVMELIKEGKNFKEVKETLEEAGTPYKGLNGVFYKWKQEIKPTQEVKRVLGISAEKRDKKEHEKPAKVRPKWTSAKQKEADNSKLAELINQATYVGLKPVCKSGKLTEKDVQSVNLGGGFIGLAQYYIPGLDLNHPIMITVTRALVLFIKFKAICGLGKRQVPPIEEPEESLCGTGGIKKEWQV